MNQSGESLGLERGTVRVVPYDPAWAAAFAAERERILVVLGDLPAVVEHVGSTSVPGLAAKPILDIMVGRPPAGAPEPYVRALEGAGYVHRGANGIPGRDYFVRGDPRTHHLHMVALGGEFWTRNLAFRDHLRRSPESAAAYAALKHDLAARHADDRETYTEGKTAFIDGVVRTALGRGGDEAPGAETAGSGEAETQLPIRPSIECWIVDEDGGETRVLLLLALAGAYWPDFWQAVSGGMEAGETPVETCVREVWEETGLRVSPEQIESLGLTMEIPIPSDGWTVRKHVFLARAPQQPVTLSPEHKDARWVPLRDVEAMLHWDSCRTALAHVRRRLGADPPADPASHEDARPEM